MNTAVRTMLQQYAAEINELRDLVAEQKIVPFVGAGMSCSVGLPGWSGFVRTCAIEADAVEEINALLDADRYPEAASVLNERLGAHRLQEKIQESFGDGAILEVEAVEPVTLIPYLGRGVFATTNFDNVLEAVFDAAGSPFKARHVGAAMEGGTMALIKNHHHLLKIHGSHESEESRVITAEEYSASYGGLSAADVKIDKLLPFLLVELFVSRHALFIGCSLSSDLTMQLLHSIYKKTRTVKHFALMSDKEVNKKACKRLKRGGIKPIVYPQKHRREAISAVLRAVLPDQQPSRQLGRFYEVCGILVLIIAVVTFVGFATFKMNGPGPRFLLFGLPAIAILEMVLLTLATRHAVKTPSQRATQRLMPGFGATMSGRWERLRWVPWFFYIGFPLFVCGHFIQMQKHLKMVRLPNADFGHHHLDVFPFPEFFSWSTVDLAMPFLHEPWYRWDNDKGVHAFPFIQPWAQTLLGVAAIAFGIYYLFRCITGWKCNRLITKMRLEPRPFPETGDLN